MMTTDQLRAWRAAKRWTQTEAAVAIGWKTRSYQMAEAARGAVSTRMELAVWGYEAMQPRPTVQSVALLGDLSDEENIKQCEHELRRATSDGATADWARRWGDAITERLRAVAGASSENADALEEAEKELTRIETKCEEISQAADALIKVLDGGGEQSEVLQRAIANLENAL